MAKKDKFEALLDTALAGSSIEGIFDKPVVPEESSLAPSGPEAAAPEKKTKANRQQITPEQRRAVENARNAPKGRGKKKGVRKMVAFQAPVEIADRIEDLTFSLGKSKNDLYNEALELLVKKYKND